MNCRKKKLHILRSAFGENAGFTLVEIVVATTIFAMTVSALMGLFNYVLKINRRSEALRQATQGMRNFVELMAKEVRNGDIDYGIIGGTQKSASWPVGPCTVSAVGAPTYSASGDNWLGITTVENEQACIYFADFSGSSLGSGVFVCPPTGPNCTIVMEKPGGVKDILNPPNFRIDSLKFLVRPVCDPFTITCPLWGSSGNGLPKWQPFVTMIVKFVAALPTGEKVPIYYQTTITSGRTDIPNL